MIRIFRISHNTHVVFRGVSYLGILIKMRTWQWHDPNSVVSQCYFGFKNLIDAARDCLRKRP